MLTVAHPELLEKFALRSKALYHSAPKRRAGQFEGELIAINTAIFSQSGGYMGILRIQMIRC